MAKMRAMVVHKVGGPLVAETRDIPIPRPWEMRIRGKARFRVVLEMNA